MPPRWGTSMVWVFGMMGIDGWLLSCAVVMLWTPAPFFWSIQIRCIYFFFDFLAIFAREAHNLTKL